MKGKFFGCFEVVEFSGKGKNGQYMWLCRCSCGAEKIIFGHHLRNNEYKTCKVTRFYKENEYYIGINHEGDIKFKFDEKHLNRVRQHNWHIDGEGYVITKIKNERIKLHNFLTNSASDMEVDHINHDLLDNRDCNLRICLHEENCYNRRKQKGNYSSIYKGVYWAKVKKKWIAKIGFKEKRIWIGTFYNEIDAAKAYNAKAIKLFGEFAKLNNI